VREERGVRVFRQPALICGRKIVEHVRHTREMIFTAWKHETESAVTHLTCRCDACLIKSFTPFVPALMAPDKLGPALLLELSIPPPITAPSVCGWNPPPQLFNYSQSGKRAGINILACCCVVLKLPRYSHLNLFLNFKFN